MKIIITDIDTGEEETMRLPAPRQDQVLGDETVRRQREFAIDTVILESLKFIGNRDTSRLFVESPNSRVFPMYFSCRDYHTHPEDYPFLRPCSIPPLFREDED